VADGYEKLELLIDGNWRQGSSGAGEDILNPANEEVLAFLPHASKEDLDEALASAQRGFEVWRRVEPAERGRLLKRVGGLIREELPRLARIMTLEQGKPLHEARGELMSSAELLEWLGEEAARVFGRVLPTTSSGQIQLVSYEPVGVVLGLSPWNFPNILPAGKIGHALAAGCSIIVKPAEETPGSAIALARLFERAGLPKGVLNVVFGVPSEVSSYLIASPIVRKVAFTGSVPVGKQLYELCAKGMKKVTLELGGHAPVVVFDDVDVDEVARITAESKFANAGQVCVSPTRFYVHDRVADKFAARFSEIAKSLKVDSGLADGVQMGPMANHRRIQAMEALVSDAASRGAEVTTGGQRIGNRGYFWEPTVLTDVPTDAKMMQVEPFGPLAPINRWDDLNDVIAQANGLPYGLTAYAFTNSQRRADEMAEALEAGMIGVNSMSVAGHMVPFGGVKDSGIGRVGGLEGLQEYMVTKTVSHLRRGFGAETTA
jgi:succinate-semialdehyde dehydrogenase / glutarate-semialdehyde dehydrogenase